MNKSINLPLKVGQGACKLSKMSINTLKVLSIVIKELPSKLNSKRSYLQPNNFYSIGQM